MFATDTHLFVGMHRTGTSWVCRVLEAAFGPSKMPVQHTPVSRVHPAIKNGRTIIGCFRNPWHWYASRWSYAYATAKRPENRLSFCDYLDAHMANPHGPIGKACEDFPKTDMRVGAFTYLHLAYHCEQADVILPGLTNDLLQKNYRDWLSCDRMMRTESLDTDTLAVFGLAVEPHLNQWRNKTLNHPYRECYDSPGGYDWRRRIGELDGALIELYECKFE